MAVDLGYIRQMILSPPGRPSVARRGAWFIFAWLLAAQAWAANGTGQHLEYFALKYRSGAELLPVVKPLLGGGGIVSTSQNELVVRAPPTRLIEIRRVVAEFDVPSRRLQITIRETGESPAGGGKSYSTQALEAQRTTQSVQVVEGVRAFIQSGQSLPVTSAAVVAGPGGTCVAGNTEFRELNRGFHAMAWVLGDQVTVEISASSLTPPGVNAGSGTALSQAVATTVSGKLGNWLEVGSWRAQARSGATNVSTRDVRTASGVQRILLKVEELH